MTNQSTTEFRRQSGTLFPPPHTPKCDTTKKRFPPRFACWIYKFGLSLSNGGAGQSAERIALSVVQKAIRERYEL